VAADISLKLLKNIPPRFSRNDESVQHPTNHGIIIVSANSLIALHCAKLTGYLQLALTLLRRCNGYLEEPNPFLPIPSAVSFGDIARNGKASSPNLITEHSVSPIITALG
jgi:hypothetical protein